MQLMQGSCHSCVYIYFGPDHNKGINTRTSFNSHLTSGFCEASGFPGLVQFWQPSLVSFYAAIDPLPLAGCSELLPPPTVPFVHPAIKYRHVILKIMFII